MNKFYIKYKEWIDQSLHFSYCALFAFLELLGRVHIWAIPLAFLFPYLFACGREWYQHDRLILFNKDIGFSCIGAVSGIIVSFLLGV